MLDKAVLDDSVNVEVRASESPVVWGCDEIGRVIGRNPRQTFHLLATNQIACAKKIGGRWVASRAALLREFGA
jgi:hypothetical protein